MNSRRALSERAAGPWPYVEGFSTLEWNDLAFLAVGIYGKPG